MLNLVQASDQLAVIDRKSPSTTEQKLNHNKQLLRHNPAYKAQQDIDKLSASQRASNILVTLQSRPLDTGDYSINRPPLKSSNIRTFVCRRADAVYPLCIAEIRCVCV